jgi:Zn-dependent protease with chaperone function
LGDASNVASLATTLPTLVLHTSYSRDFEREADQFSFELLKKTGRSPKLFAEAMAALEAERARDDGDEGCATPEEAGSPPKEPKKPRSRLNLGYLSTHPETQERIKAAEEAAR